jgi:parallel beta-helix repeat protein
MLLLSCSPLWAATYYVDNCVAVGNDLNNGTSPSTAWLTINKVNTSTFLPGDSILFQSTCTWREQLTVPSSGSAGSPITVGAYGSGALPIINGAALLSSGWTVTSGDIWQASLTTQPQQVFFNGVRGSPVGSVGAVTGANDWCWASNVLYVYSTSEPTTAFTSPGVEASVRNYGIRADGKPYLTIQNLEVKYSNQLYGSGGLTVANRSSNVLVNGVVADYNWGKGIEIVDEDSDNNISNVTVENSQAYYNGQEGISVSPWSGTGGTTVFSNISILNNVVHNNSQDGTLMFIAGIHLATPGTFSAYAITSSLVEGNQSYLNGVNASGTSVAAPNSGPGIWLDTTESCVVRYNESYQNAEQGIFIENGDANSVSNNVTWGNDTPNPDWDYSCSGITVDASRADLIGQSNVVYNNTSYKDGYCISVSGKSVATLSIANNVFTNNACSSPTVAALAAVYGAENVDEGGNTGWGSGNVYTYNAFGAAASNFIEWGHGTFYSTYSAWETASGNCGATGCSHSVEATPAFVNPSAGQFWLTGGSPGIDAGLDLGSPYNIGLMPGSAWPNSVKTGDQNAYGSGWEIGAFIYVPALAAPTNLQAVAH